MYCVILNSSINIYLVSTQNYWWIDRIEYFKGSCKTLRFLAAQCIEIYCGRYFPEAKNTMKVYSLGRNMCFFNNQHPLLYTPVILLFAYSIYQLLHHNNIALYRLQYNTVGKAIVTQIILQRNFWRKYVLLF